MIVIGQADGRDVRLDVDKLIASRLLIQANSGGGKSWTIRRLLEQSHGLVQHIVLDPEGEFATLRERYDYVLAGRGGDVAIDARTAPKLAARLMELGASAILDLYELAPKERRHYVSVFLEALVNLPKALWHPTMVVVDEAHVYCPEKGKGEAESSDAVIGLATRGRKRQYGAVLATQRIGKLNKDAAAEMRNRLIGLSVIDVDRERAGEELGWHRDKAASLRLRALEPGEFYAFGPALTRDVVKVMIGAVVTTHEVTAQTAAPPPPPRERVRAVLAKLVDLPREAEEEVRTVDALRRQVSQLQGDLVRARREQPAPEVQRIEVPILDPALITRLEAALLEAEGVADTFRTIAAPIVEVAAQTQRALDAARAVRPMALAVPPGAGRFRAAPKADVPERHAGSSPAASTDRSLGRAERRILSVLAQYQTRTVQQVSVLTGYAIGGGGFNNALGKLRSLAYIEGRDPVAITDAGFQAAEVEVLPQPGPELVRYWLGRLGRAEAEILRVLTDAYPRALAVEEVAAETTSQTGRPYEPTGGGFNNAVGRLRTLELIEGTKLALQATDALMGLAVSRGR